MGIFNNLFDIDSRDSYAVTGLNKELNSLYIYNYFIKNKKNNLVITNSLYEANDVYNRLLNYTNKVLFFPMDDFITSEVTDISPEFVIDRLTTLNKLLGSGKYIVVTNLMGILRYLPNTKLYKNKIIDINKDMDIDRDDFINKLFDLGYEKKPVVSRTGEMAIRGYVIDIFPIEFDNPIRIEFWGDTIDSIKYFDLDDQISNTSVDSVKIYPYTEFLIDGKIGDNIIRKQKYLLNYSDSVSGLWNYVSDSVIFYYDYNQIINSYSLLRENILEYDSELDDDIKTNYMWDIEDISNKHNIYILDIDNLIDLDVNNKKYVSFKVSYPREEVIDTFDIDSNGTFMTPDVLEPGKYILYEVDTDMDGYLYNKENVEATTFGFYP